VGGILPAMSTAGALEVKRALVVEDDASLRRGLERSLAERCAEVRSCGSWAEASRLLRSFRPELLVLDLYLADGDAFALVDEAARCDPPPAVVAMSGGEAEEASELHRRGVRIRVRKPLTGPRLRRALDEAVRSLRREPARR
jgi:DNA-binding NtrC family response regulator